MSSNTKIKPDAQSLETYFEPFRRNVIGCEQHFDTPFGSRRIVYADWTASGRLYLPIERLLMEEVAPFVGNTHTETTLTGSAMTQAYHQAKKIIKSHLGARESDILISSNSGMTGVVNKFQRILGLKLHEHFYPMVNIPREERPLVLCSHMEHHSNQTSWLETVAEVEVIKPDQEGLMDLHHLNDLLEKYKHRKTKIAAITSYSNVTGIATPYHEVAEIMHRNGGLCFVDFAASAPYIRINMRPENELQHIDALYFSPHKFLGGPGSSGILVFDPRLYKNRVPDNPGGGTVDWTNPWGEHKYIDEIETREDGGTPAFLQTIKVALCVKLKEQMGVDKMLEREHQMIKKIWQRLEPLENLHLLAGQHRDRLGIVSFYVDELHYNLGVRLLNDRYGIQVRGGCSCAGTYGHYLLHVSKRHSRAITSRINIGDLSQKPGWIRLSVHPVMTDEEIDYILEAIEALCRNHRDWAEDYIYHAHTNEFSHKSQPPCETQIVANWFNKELL